MLKIYRVKLINQEIPCDIRQWDIVANDLPSAWRKFNTQSYTAYFTNGTIAKVWHDCQGNGRVTICTESSEHT